MNPSLNRLLDAVKAGNLELAQREATAIVDDANTTQEQFFCSDCDTYLEGGRFGYILHCESEDDDE